MMRLFSLTPQCEGHPSTLQIFSFKELGHGRGVYEINHREGKYTLGAGAVQGVVDGAEFAVYLSPHPRSGDIPVARVIATDVKTSSADLMFAPSSPVSALAVSDGSSYFASPSRMGRSAGLHLHVALSHDLIPVMLALAKERVRKDPKSPEILLVDEPQANLSPRITRGGRVEYLIRDPLIRSHGLETLGETTLPIADHIHPILVAASKFFWHLHRSPALNQRLEDENIHTEMHELRLRQSDNSNRRSFVKSGNDLVRSGIVDIQVDRDRMHGLTIYNRSSRPVYVWAFYFDCSNLSICKSGYRRGLRDPADVCLVAYCSSLRVESNLSALVGSGMPERNRPFMFYLPPSEHLDVGIIKFFISTEDIDLSWICQDSPFENSSTRSIAEVPAGAREEPARWSSALITVVQRSSR